MHALSFTSAGDVMIGIQDRRNVPELAIGSVDLIFGWQSSSTRVWIDHADLRPPKRVLWNSWGWLESYFAQGDEVFDIAHAFPFVIVSGGSYWHDHCENSKR